jgi:hypothetical protein
MATFDHLIDLDGNGRPIYGDSPFRVFKDHTFVGSGATVVVNLFTVTGAVMVTRLWGVVTTTFGANHTAAHFRVNDQTATDQVITAAAGTTLNAIKKGALILKDGLAAAAVTYKSADAASLLEPTTLQTNMFSPFMVVQKTGGVKTEIEYVYTTSDTPTSGAMRFYVSYYPLSESSVIAAQ